MPHQTNILNTLIHKEENAFTSFNYNKDNVNLLTGWNSENPDFEALLRDKKPKVYIETGTWLGGSAIKAAKIMRDLNIDGTVICIDTFLGCHHLHRMDEWRPTLKYKNARPTFYETFLSNVVHEQLTDYILPVSLPSLSGARLMKELGIFADFVYIDASHVSPDVYIDLHAFWPLVKLGGTLCGDDYKDHTVNVPKGQDPKNHANNFNGLIEDFNKFAFEVRHPLTRPRHSEKVWIENKLGDVNEI